MKHIERCVFTLLFALSCGFVAAERYGVVAYAEGPSFMRIRDGKTEVFRPDERDVAGMEVLTGDIYQTSKGAFLELTFDEIGATVQIAENTSFRCYMEDGGKKSSGELYYGRVRAKVGKLTGGSTYRLSSPSLVAGVRGTNFGLDVISNEDTSRVLHRVFCLEGSVLVGDLYGPTLKTVLLKGQEMVEKVAVPEGTAVEGDPAASAAEPAPLVKEPVAAEVVGFWERRPFAAAKATAGEAPASAETAVADASDTTEPKDKRDNVKLLRNTGSALMVVGILTSIGSALWRNTTESDDWRADAGITAGVVMFGSGGVLALLTAFAD